MAVPISAFVLTHNNESTIERALKSLEFAAEIVVVDSGSSDGTLEIVKKYSDKLMQRPWPGFDKQFQFAQDQCTHDWVLCLDSDEEISENLAGEIQKALELNANRPENKQFHGFSVQRRSFFLDRWITHGGWVPDRKIRLYQRQLGSWEGDPHAKMTVRGKVRKLRSYCYHYSYDNLAAQLQTLNNYSTVAVEYQDRDETGKKRFSLIRLLVHPLWRFFKEYFIKRGFMDGLPGLIIAVNNSSYVFNKYAKLWERQKCSADKVEQNKLNKRP